MSLTLSHVPFISYRWNLKLPLSTKVYLLRGQQSKGNNVVLGRKTVESLVVDIRILHLARDRVCARHPLKG